MNEFLVFAAGYAIIIAATANVGWVCFSIGVKVGARQGLKQPSKEVLPEYDRSL